MSARWLALVVVIAPVLAHADRRAVAIRRTTPGELPKRATAAQATALLTEADWRYLVPDKRTETYESKTFAFDPTGKVEILTANAWGPSTTKVAWKLVRAGDHPVITIARQRYTLGACKGADHAALCLAGPRP